MLGQLRQPFRAQQRLQGQPPDRGALHVRGALRVRHREHQVVAQHAQRRTLRPLAGVDARDQLRRRVHAVADRHPVIGRHDQPRAPVADVVRHVERPARKGHQLERFPRKHPLDAVVQVGARVAGVHVLFFAADDEAQIGLRQEPQRRARTVVEIGRSGHEPAARLFDEADVGSRAEQRVAQPLRRQPLERVVERQRVHEDGARDVGPVGRQAAVPGGVDPLGQRRASLAPGGGDVVGDRRQVGGLPQAGDDLLADRLMAQVDVVQVDGGGVRGLRLPKLRDGARQQPQHAAHALEVAQRGGLAGEGGQHFGVQRIARGEGLRGLRAGGVRGQRAAVQRPLLAVGVDHLARAASIRSNRRRRSTRTVSSSAVGSSSVALRADTLSASAMRSPMKRFSAP